MAQTVECARKTKYHSNDKIWKNVTDDISDDEIG